MFTTILLALTLEDSLEDSGRQWKTVEYVCQHLGLIDLGSTKYVDASAKFMIEAFHTRM
jgi:hypothetical protein